MKKIKNYSLTISDNLNGVAVILVSIPLMILIGKSANHPLSEGFREIFSLVGILPGLSGGHRFDLFLFIPLGTIIVVFVRLTLGIRLLGAFRPILIAIAFQITGIFYGMAFLFFVIGIISLIWPIVKEARLPYFARVSVILSSIVFLVFSALLASKWLQLDSLSLLAYFPMIVLCYLAEGFARTIYNEGLPSAIWRGVMTVAVAILILSVFEAHDWKNLLLQFPEVLLAQIGLIFFITENLDLRLLQRINPPIGNDFSFSFSRPIHQGSQQLRIAVVRNRKNNGVVNRFGTPSPEKYGKKTVQMILDGLRAKGHTVKLFEGDGNLMAGLKEFIPPAGDQHPSGMVFNLSYGIQGESRYTHIPALLEMLGVPYTGANPLGHAVSLDKVTAKILMENAGVPTPSYRVLRRPDDSVEGLRYPLIVKPRHESTSYGLSLVRNRKELMEKAARIIQKFQQDVLVEEFIRGREVCIGILGNGDSAGCLPIVEFDYGGRDARLLSWDDKYHKSADEPGKICPAPVEESLAERLRNISLQTFRACHCRDYARVDIRIDENNNPHVLEINSGASLGPGGSFVLAAKTAGYTYEDLVGRIVEVAHKRYFDGGESEESALLEDRAPLSPIIPWPALQCRSLLDDRVLPMAESGKTVPGIR